MTEARRARAVTYLDEQLLGRDEELEFLLSDFAEAEVASSEITGGIMCVVGVVVGFVLGAICMAWALAR